MLTLHAEFMYTGGCGHSIECLQWSTHNGCGFSEKCPRYRSEFHSYFDRSSTMWRRMRNAFDGFNNNLIVTSVSPWLMERAKQSPILGDKKHCVVFNGLDTSVFHSYTKEDNETLKDELGIKSKKVVFHATPNFNNLKGHIKGGLYVIELAKKMVEVTFVVAGPKNGEFVLPNNVISLGRVLDQNRLAKLYSMADVTLLTSQRETFSMVTAESLCCGTPVIGFKAGGPEGIALQEYSEFLEYGDINKLISVMKVTLNKTKDPYIVVEAKKKYDKEIIIREYIDVYKRLCEEN